MRSLEPTARVVTSLAVDALAAESPAAAMRRVADALPGLLGVDGAVFVQHGVEGMEVLHGVSPTSLWPQMPLHIAPIDSVRRMHPLIDHLCAYQPSAPGRMSDIVSDREWQKLEIAELGRPIWGCNRQLHLGVAPLVGGGDRGPALGGWVLTRDGSDYSNRELELAAAVSPVLDVVARNYLVSRSGQASVLDLTPREVVVLRLAAQGGTSYRIGHVLGISPRTVHKHLERAYRRLAVTDRVSAIRVATANGLFAKAVNDPFEPGQLF